MADNVCVIIIIMVKYDKFQQPVFSQSNFTYFNIDITYISF